MGDIDFNCKILITLFYFIKFCSIFNSIFSPNIVLCYCIVKFLKRTENPRGLKFLWSYCTGWFVKCSFNNTTERISAK